MNERLISCVKPVWSDLRVEDREIVMLRLGADRDGASRTSKEVSAIVNLSVERVKEAEMRLVGAALRHYREPHLDS